MHATRDSGHHYGENIDGNSKTIAFARVYLIHPVKRYVSGEIKYFGLVGEFKHFRYIR